MIANDACMPWTGQISINLLEDEELVQLIRCERGAGFSWAGIGDPLSLKVAHKEFNKPSQYKKFWTCSPVQPVRNHIIHLRMDGDQPGVQDYVGIIELWPPGFRYSGCSRPIPTHRFTTA